MSDAPQPINPRIQAYDDLDFDQDEVDAVGGDEEFFDCHMGPDGQCGAAGSEMCDFECPTMREVGCLVVSMLADRLEVFAAGPDSGEPSAAGVLHAGFLKLNVRVLRHGND